MQVISPVNSDIISTVPFKDVLVSLFKSSTPNTSPVENPKLLILDEMCAFCDGRIISGD